MLVCGHCWSVCGRQRFYNEPTPHCWSVCGRQQAWCCAAFAGCCKRALLSYAVARVESLYYQCVTCVAWVCCISVRAMLCRCAHKHDGAWVVVLREEHAVKQLEQIQLMMQMQPCLEYICAGCVVCMQECAGLKLQASQGKLARKSKPEQADCCGQTVVCWLCCMMN
jgi:hypothetical protein